MKFFTSDLHFGHKNILTYQPKRPWKDVDEMREGIINNWNSVVKPEDEVYIIGDFSFLSAKPTVGILQRLNGKKKLVRGNHDDVSNPEVREQFEWIKEFHEENVDLGDDRRQKIVMCHYALRVWNKSHHGSWNLYGHSHGSLPPEGKQLDVSIDATCELTNWFGSNYGVLPFHPISLDQVRAILDDVEQHKVDHH